MKLNDLLERFKNDCPITVGTRLVLTQLLKSERTNHLFEQHAVRQKCGELAFSTVADLMGMVALNIKPSVHAAYKAKKQEVGVSVTSVYNKLQGIEPQVGRALVRETARDLVTLFDSMKGPKPLPILSGYKTRIIDGNHLAGTEHRIEQLRSLGAAALPGLAIPILDPDKKLLFDVISCRDGHANEATLHPQIIELVKPGEVWMGDRAFGSMMMMTSIAIDKRAHFIFRHSRGLVPNWTAQGRRRKIANVEGGKLYEQPVEIEHQGRTLLLRRITIVLDKPTRKGDQEIHLLTNLPRRISAKRVAKAYRKRWNIETAFQQLATTLQSEIKTLGYPEAALFSFCVAMMMHNLLSVIKTSIGCAHRDAAVADEVSSYYASKEVSESWKGFQTALSQDEFESIYGEMTLEQVARELVRIGRQLDLSAYQKSRRGPKRPPPKKKSGNRGNHVSTARILDQRAA
jgi:hypothetical protein